MQAFAAAMSRFVSDRSLSAVMGMRGRERVRALFSRQAFAKSLESTCVKLVKQGSIHDTGARAWALLFVYVCVFVLAPALAAGIVWCNIL